MKWHFFISHLLQMSATFLVCLSVRIYEEKSPVLQNFTSRYGHKSLTIQMHRWCTLVLTSENHLGFISIVNKFSLKSVIIKGI